MKKNILLATLIISASLLLISFANASKTAVAASATVVNDSSITDEMESIESERLSESENAASIASSIYSKLNLKNLGLSMQTLAYAITGYQKLEAAGKVSNSLLTIVDMGQSSRKKRLYIIDMEKQQLVWNTFVSHGKNSGLDMATRFSNAVNSNASSLGFYVTKQTYHGKHGLSLRLSGVEQGFNHNAEARAIVVHGANYVNAGRVNSGYMGRSLGCPALPQQESATVINKIKGGSVMFIYHPTQKYIQGSDLING